MTRSRSTFPLLVLLILFTLTGCPSEPTAPESNQADLSVSKAAQSDAVTEGEEISYTITVANGGPQAADGVTMTDVVPQGTSFVSATTSAGQCSESGGTVTCGVGSLSSGSHATVTLRVRADQAGQVTNTATGSGLVLDSVPGNDSATETTTVNP